MRKFKTWSAALWVLCLSAGAVSVEASESTSEGRRWVLTQPTQLRDLYIDGALTDTRGNRWAVKVVPGVRPTFRGAAKSFDRAGDDLHSYVDPGFWSRRGEAFGDGIEFGFKKSIGDFVLEGISEDYRETNQQLKELAQNTPFGWMPRMLWKSMSGYVLVPSGRIVFGTSGAAAGTAYALTAPVLGGMGPTFSATADVAFCGIAFPAAKLVWHQPAYLLATLNREPSEADDGKYGLSIERNFTAEKDK